MTDVQRLKMENQNLLETKNALNIVKDDLLQELDQIANKYAKVKIELEKNDVSSVIFESIQGVGGLDQPNDEFISNLSKLCKKYDVCLIADEVQSGFGRSGDFFGYQKFKIEPDIITLAKGMGNGFPVGGVLINRKIKPKYFIISIFTVEKITIKINLELKPYSMYFDS